MIPLAGKKGSKKEKKNTTYYPGLALRNVHTSLKKSFSKKDWLKKKSKRQSVLLRGLDQSGTGIRQSQITTGSFPLHSRNPEVVCTWIK
jgi:hypothetical protein